MNPPFSSLKKKKTKYQVRLTEPDASITNGWDEEIVDATIPGPLDYFTKFASEPPGPEGFHEPEPNSSGYPWLQLQDCPIYLSASERLQKETFAFYEYLQPNPEEKMLRNKICEFIETITLDIWPDARLHAFGSFTTQLYLPTSDIDLVILVPEKDMDTLTLLELLLDQIKKTMNLEFYEIRNSSRVPIINFTESKTGIQVDISINKPKGIYNSKRVEQFITQYPAVRPLSMIIRHFLRLESLQRVYEGGLGSYATTLLVISFIQVHTDLEAKTKRPELYLGELLKDFFKFYGVDFKNEEFGITLKKRRISF